MPTREELSIVLRDTVNNLLVAYIDRHNPLYASLRGKFHVSTEQFKYVTTESLREYQDDCARLSLLIDIIFNDRSTTETERISATTALLKSRSLPVPCPLTRETAKASMTKNLVRYTRNEEKSVEEIKAEEITLTPEMLLTLKSLKGEIAELVMAASVKTTNAIIEFFRNPALFHLLSTGYDPDSLRSDLSCYCTRPLFETGFFARVGHAKEAFQSRLNPRHVTLSRIIDSLVQFADCCDIELSLWEGDKKLDAQALRRSIEDTRKESDAEQTRLMAEVSTFVV